MKDPQRFDPARQKNIIKTSDPAASPFYNDKPNTSPNYLNNPHRTNKKSPAIPAGMPSITDNHKQSHLAPKQPFKWQFLLPKYWGIWLLLAIILPLIYLPLAWQFWLGRKIGIAIYHLAKTRQNDTLVNLRLAFPEKPEAERELMAKQVFVNQGIGIFETLCAWLRPNVFTRTVSISGLQHLISAQQQGRAVLLLGAHYTMLDLGGLLLTQFTPLDCVYRPQNNALLEWLVYNCRRKLFEHQISHRNMRALVNSIKANHVIWYSPDQDFGLKHGVMAPFFGVPAATITAPRRLAKLGDKAYPPVVVALHAYRQTADNLPRGKRPHYHLTITPALDNYPSDDEVFDAKRVNELLEGLIRIDPTQWMWFHRRFKHNESGRTDYYD